MVNKILEAIEKMEHTEKINAATKSVKKHFNVVDAKELIVKGSNVVSAAQYVDEDTKDIGIKAYYAAHLNFHRADNAYALAKAAYTRDIQINSSTWQTLYETARAYDKAVEALAAEVLEQEENATKE